MKNVAIILNTPDEIAEVKEHDVICADAGYRHFSGTPIAVVGDFDSDTDIPSSVLKITYPIEKNETDGQLCLDYAKELNYDNVVIYGALGGRIDHVLGNIGLLLYARSIGLNAVIREKCAEIALCDNDFSLEVNIGDTISFVALEDAVVKSSEGLYYPYDNLSVSVLSNRSLSNIATEKIICLKILSGTLIYIWNKNN